MLSKRFGIDTNKQDVQTILYTSHRWAQVGQKRTYQEFRTRAVLAATTLGTPVSDVSPVQSENGGMIAIISDCSSVREGGSLVLEFYLP